MINMLPTLADDVKSKLGIYSDRGIEKIMTKVLQHFYRLDRAGLVGPVAVEAGISLRQLMVVIEALIDAGTLRIASSKEVMSQGWGSDAVAYALTPETKRWLAHDR